MREGATIGKIRKARKEGRLTAGFTGSDLVQIDIPKGTAWTFLFKHCIDRGEGYERFKKYFRQNSDKTYSLLESIGVGDGFHV